MVESLADELVVGGSAGVVGIIMACGGDDVGDVIIGNLESYEICVVI